MTVNCQFSIPGQSPITKIRDGVWQFEDHQNGFDCNGFFKVSGDRSGCEEIVNSTEPVEIHTEYILPSWVKQNYPQHTFKFDAELMIRNNHFEKAINYENIDQQLVFDNFLCCFNRSEHVGRHWLTEELFKRKLFSPDYCSKGFQIPNNHIDAQMHNFRKMIVEHGTNIDASDVVSNLTELSPLIKPSFINLVSETLPENYVIFPTEKFLFPILNRRLWLAYAPPGYHKFLVETLGFQLYDDFFDYSFDAVEDPCTRLSTLLDSIEPFSKITKNAWYSIYKSLEPVIEYNYQWAKSGQFIDRLRALGEVTNSVSITESA